MWNGETVSFAVGIGAPKCGETSTTWKMSPPAPDTYREARSLSIQELDAVLAAVDPLLLKELRATYVDIADTPSDASLRFALVDWSERRGGLGAGFLAELELLAVGRRADVRRESMAHGTPRSTVQIVGPAPVAVTFLRHGAAITLWCSQVTMHGFDGEPRTFLLAPLAALEGCTGLPDDLPELLDGAPKVMTLAGRELAVEAVGVQRGLDLAILAVPPPVGDAAQRSCSLDGATDPSAAVIGWVLDEGAPWWCHGIVRHGAVPLPGTTTAAVMPLFGARGVAYRDADPRLDFRAARLYGFVGGGRLLAASAVRRLVARALLRRASWDVRLAWAVRRLFVGRAVPKAAEAAGRAAGDLRLIDWLYPETHGLDGAHLGDILVLLAALNIVALGTYGLGAWALSSVLDPPYGVDKLAHQVRMGFGVLTIIGVGIPTLHGVRAGLLGAGAGVIVGLSTLVVCSLADQPATGIIAGAILGALFGTIGFLGSPGEVTARGAIDLRRLFRLIGTIAFAGLVCTAGHALTRSPMFRGREWPIALSLALLLLVLIAPVLLRLLRYQPGGGSLRPLARLYVGVVVALVGLIWLGMAFARHEDLIGLFEGAAFAGIASVLLFVLAPLLRRTSPATHRIVLGGCLPLLVTAVLSVVLPDDRWRYVSGAFAGGLGVGALVAFVLHTIAASLSRRWRS